MKLRRVPSLAACVLLIAATPAIVGLPLVPLGLHEVDYPSSDPPTAVKSALGRRFFNDTRLSSDRRTACATCHAPATGFAERSAITVPAGLIKGTRNSQTVLNSGYRASLGWDGRFKTLEDQVKGSFSPWGDMGVDIGTAIEAIERDTSYEAACLEAFGMRLSSDCLIRAIAAFERSLVGGNSRFDAFLFADNATALTEKERRGWELFKGRAGCITCHDVFHKSTNDLGSQYALFSDERFHNLGVGYAAGRMADTGRYAVTRNLADFGAFKTPILRDVALTPPYMHDGSITTLYDVLSFYNRGGEVNPNLSPGIKPLNLSETEKMDIVAFLSSLNSRY